jgi:hypothetical protein
MKLQYVRPQERNDIVQFLIARINGDGDDLDPAANSVSKLAGELRCNIARAFLKKDEADMAGAARDRAIHGFGSLQPTDLDVEFHDGEVTRNVGGVEAILCRNADTGERKRAATNDPKRPNRDPLTVRKWLICEYPLMDVFVSPNRKRNGISEAWRITKDN